MQNKQEATCWTEEFDKKFQDEWTRLFDKDFFDAIKDFIRQALLDAKEQAYTALDQGATCCADKHQTFYGAIVRSPQWQAWYKEQMRRFQEHADNKDKVFTGCFDVDESVGLGAISDEHLQAFFKFISEDEVRRSQMAVDLKVTENFNKALKDENSELIEIVKQTERAKIGERIRMAIQTGAREERERCGKELKQKLNNKKFICAKCGLEYKISVEKTTIQEGK